MLRLLLVALALLAPCPAQATVAVWLPYTQNAAGMAAYEGALGSLLQTFDNTGVTYTVFPWQASKTEWVRTGTVSTPAGDKTFDVNVVFAWSRAAADPTGTLNADSLAVKAKWPNKPTIIIGEPSAASSRWDDNSTIDSLSNGCYGATLPGSSYTHYTAQAMFVVGYDEVFRRLWNLNEPGTTLATRISTTYGGIFRPIVGMATANNGLASLRPNETCTYCDSLMITAAKRADPDSLFLWARYRSATDPYPLIYVAASADGQADPTLMLMALALADSASGGKVFENPAKLPLTMAIVVRGAFARQDSTGISSTDNMGTYCPSTANLCDSVNVKAGIDSLQTLGVPITVLVNVDSVASYGYEKAWWRRLTRVHYSPQPWNGVLGVQTGQNGGNATGNRLADIMGYKRSRTLIGAGQTIPYAPGVADSSIYALVSAAYARTDSIFGRNLTDHGFDPPESDFIPANWDRGNLGVVTVTAATATRTASSNLAGGMDSLVWVLYKAGVRSMVLHAEWRATMSGATIYANSGVVTINTGATGSGTQPAFTTPNTGYANVYLSPGASGSQGGLIARMPLLGTRGWPNDSPQIFFTSHDFALETLWGRIYRRWYVASAGLPYYTHMFDASTPVLEINAMHLGGLGGDGSSGGLRRAPRPGWHAAKWLVNRHRAVDRLMIPGKHVLTFTYLQDCNP